jgi:hypothetical protein
MGIVEKYVKILCRKEACSKYVLMCETFVGLFILFFVCEMFSVFTDLAFAVVNMKLILSVKFTESYKRFV